jgi:hypothetical protein
VQARSCNGKTNHSYQNLQPEGAVLTVVAEDSVLLSINNILRAVGDVVQQMGEQHKADAKQYAKAKPDNGMVPLPHDGCGLVLTSYGHFSS